MSEFAWNVGIGTGADVPARVLKAQYNGGFTQRLPDGLNNTLRKWNVVMNHRSWAQLSAVNAFLKSKKGAISFTWTPPEPLATDEGELRVVCEHWAYIYDDGGEAVGMRMDFEEVVL